MALQQTGEYVSVDCGGRVVQLDKVFYDALTKRGLSVMVMGMEDGTNTQVYTRHKGKQISISRLVLGLKDDASHALHRNGNKLDCRRKNLRRYQGGTVIGTGKNFSWSSTFKHWETEIEVDGRQYHGKTADTAQEAAKEVIRLAHKLYKKRIISRACLQDFLARKKRLARS